MASVEKNLIKNVKFSKTKILENSFDEEKQFHKPWTLCEVVPA